MKVDGKPLDLQADTPSIAMIRQFLEGSPEDEVFTSETVLSKLNISQFSLTRARPKLEGLSMLHGKNRYWGSAKAIAALATAVGR